SVIFGAAKPVPVNTRNLRNPKRDHMWIAAAGPASNVILATAAIIVVNLVWSPQPDSALENVLGDWVYINLVLATFNMIPLHPLDGSWILSRFLSGNAATAYASLRPYGFLILIFLMYTGVLWQVINPVMRFASMFLP
ncbi:MAG TPA: site-2 protease family protein, partial [Acidobacteriota bacterium]|nr:site-2 protease family protein [Acidobacteriota bacterium]